MEPEDAAGMTLSSKAGQIITLPTVGYSCLRLRRDSFSVTSTSPLNSRRRDSVLEEAPLGISAASRGFVSSMEIDHRVYFTARDVPEFFPPPHLIGTSVFEEPTEKYCGTGRGSPCSIFLSGTRVVPCVLAPL